MIPISQPLEQIWMAVTTFSANHASASQVLNRHSFVFLVGLLVLSCLLHVWTLRKLLKREARCKHLQRADQIKDEFLANTAHELRSPLICILRLSRSLQEDGNGDQETQSALSRILAAGQDLELIVSDLESYAGIEPDKYPLVLESVDVHDVANTALALISVPAAAKGVKLNNNIQSRTPHVHADKMRFQHILTYLLDQVLERLEMGSVTIEGSVNGEMLSIVLTGKGTLIPETNLSIYGEKECDKPQVNLTIVRRLIDLHAGRLKIHTNEENKVTITVSLPISNKTRRVEFDRRQRSLDANQDFLRIIPNPANFNPADFTIFIVDDDLINRRVLVNYLITANYRVREASGGEEGLQILKTEGPFDLVLLDIMMPGITGYEMCREIRKDYPIHELPIVFLTAKDQKNDLAEGFSSGANDYMVKPFDWPELLSRVRIHLQLLDIHRTLEKRISERTRDLHARHVELTDGLALLETENKNWSKLEKAVKAINSKTAFYEVIHEILKQGFEIFPGAAKGVCLQWDSIQKKYFFVDTIGYELDKLEEIRFNGEALIERLTAREEPTKPGIYLGKNFEYDGRLKTEIPIPKATLAMKFTLEDESNGYLVWDNPVNVHAFNQSDIEKLSHFRIHAFQALSKAWNRQQCEYMLTEFSQSKNYLRRIQNAGMGAPDAQLPEHFIIFKPKGITSGDLFWVREKNDTLFLAIIATPLKGLPGSFLSQTGYHLLDRAFFQFRLENPGRILENLHRELKTGLIQERNGNMDENLDVCLCRIDRELGRVVFASARLSLARVRFEEGRAHLEVIKGEPQSIGGATHRDAQFSNHEFTIAPGEMLYLASDGFMKQTNADDLKYGPRRYHAFLESIADRSITAQNELFLEELANYRGEEAQSEDISIMGLRL